MTGGAWCSEDSPCVKRVLSLLLGSTGGGAFFIEDLDHVCGCGFTTATLGGTELEKPEDAISNGGGGRRSRSGGGGGKSVSEGGEGNSDTGSFERAGTPGPLLGGPPGGNIKLTAAKFNLPGFEGAGGDEVISGVEGPEGIVGCSNLLLTVSTGFLDSLASAQLGPFILECLWGVGGGFFPPGLDIFGGFLIEVDLTGVEGGVGLRGGSWGRLLSGGGGGNSGDGRKPGCHLGFAFTAGGDVGV